MISFILYSTTTTYPGHCGHHFVGKQVKIEAIVLENVLEQFDNLQRQHVLAAIISHFKNCRFPRVIGLVLFGVGLLVVTFLEFARLLFQFVDTKVSDLKKYVTQLLWKFSFMMHKSSNLLEMWRGMVPWQHSALAGRCSS
jgi:hypothetical protein